MHVWEIFISRGGNLWTVTKNPCQPGLFINQLCQMFWYVNFSALSIVVYMAHELKYRYATMFQRYLESLQHGFIHPRKLVQNLNKLARCICFIHINKKLHSLTHSHCFTDYTVWIIYHFLISLISKLKCTNPPNKNSNMFFFRYTPTTQDLRN